MNIKNRKHKKAVTQRNGFHFQQLKRIDKILHTLF